MFRPTPMLCLLCLPLSLLHGCASDDGGIPGADVHYTEQREVCSHRNPLRNLYFGDLHFHTRNSWDAWGYHLTVTPPQAYGFAAGGQVMLPPLDGAGKGTRQARLDRPLDFAAATDHAEFLGETRLCTTAGSKAYDSPTCQNFRKQGTSAVAAWGMQLIVPEGNQRFADVCGASGGDCLAAARTVWGELQRAAEQAYDRSAACTFVSFVGYEYTVTPKATNMHRNVIFRNDQVPQLPVSYYEAPDALQLWQQLDQKCPGGDDACDVMVVPHNMNMSNGNMFVPATGADAQNVARLRARLEPVLELFQHKGDQECQPGLSGIQGAQDAQCAFEKERQPPITDCLEQPGWGGMSSMGCLSRWDFLRGILLAGMQQQEGLGLNPYHMGVVGSTDTHNGTPGNTREQGWVGHVGSSDDTPEERLGPGNTTHRGLVNNPGGLAAVWSVERSRDAIFEALRRREVYATSGTRIQVRLFGGWGYPDGLCDDPDLAREGFEGGVPMGGVLPGQRGSGGPTFVVQALQDPGTTAAPGTPLRQVQMIKGWIDGAGAAHEQVFDVAGDATIGSVDPTTCKTDGKGHHSLCAVWRDPQFDPGQRAFYYARVLEAPTCRWSQWECIAIEPGQRPDGCSNPSVQTTIQERAWTSAVWYEP